MLAALAAPQQGGIYADGQSDTEHTTCQWKKIQQSGKAALAESFEGRKRPPEE